MGLWDKIKGELIDIVEWLDESDDTLVHRFERYGNEIKYGAQLIVRPGQAAVFVKEGKVGDVFEPGHYTLETRNLPILSTIAGWKYGFESPFKAEVYFVNTNRFTDLKWGTKNPVMLRDAEFGPVRLRAFGNYEFRVEDPKKLIEELVSTKGQFSVDQIKDQLRNLIITSFTDVLGESKIPVLDLAANYEEFGGFVKTRLDDKFAGYGIAITTMLIENISLPPAVEEALDKRTSMGVIGDLSKYTQYQSAEAMRDAAKNPGGMAGDGMGLGMGIAMGSQMAQNLGQAHAQTQQGGGGAPPPLPQGRQFYLGKDGQQLGPFPIEQLKQHVQSGNLTAETLVWSEGMANWQPASQVPEVSAILGSAPPPLPPS